MDLGAEQKRKNHADNMRKLWLMSQVHLPFIFAVDLLQKKWKLPSKNTKDFLKDIKLNKRSFYKDIQVLRAYFRFEEMWDDYLCQYIITDKLFAPDKKRSAHIPSKNVEKYYQAAMLNIEKKAQHNFLMKRGFRTSRKDAERTGMYIEDLPDKSFYMPQSLLRDDENIADALLGKLEDDKLSDSQLVTETRKRKNLVRQWSKRYFELHTGISDEEKSIIIKLFNT